MKYMCLLSLCVFLTFTIGCSPRSEENNNMEEESTDQNQSGMNDAANQEETPSQDGESGGILLTIDPPTMIAGSMDTAQLRIINNSADTLMTGERYSIEENNNGEWQKMSYLEDILFEDVAHIIEPGQTSDQTISFNLGDQTLDKGLYRICKNYKVQDRDTTLCTQFRVE